MGRNVVRLAAVRQRRAMQGGEEATGEAPGPGLVGIADLLHAAAQEAERTHHPHVGSEHLALLALDGPDGLVAIAAEAGLDPGAVRPALERCCPYVTEPRDGEPRVSPRSARLLATAAQLAAYDGVERIASLHIVMALLEELDALVWRGLFAARVTPEVVLDGIESREPRSRALLGTSHEGRERFLNSMTGDLTVWTGYGALIRAEERDRRELLELVRARSRVHVRAAVGCRLGHISASEASILGGDDPDTAAETLHRLLAGGRAS